MNLIIQKQQIGNGAVNSVNARELHEALEVKKHFADWIKTQIDSLQLLENEDYVVFHQKGENLLGGRPSKEFIITIEIAKHIAMASRTQKGREVRQYFIECEKQLQNKVILPQNYDEALEHLVESRRQLKQLEIINKKLVHDNKSYTSTEIAKELGFRSAIAFNKTLEEMKIQYKVNGTYVLYSKYSDLNLDIQAQQVLDTGKVIYYRKWTGKGRAYFLDLFNKGDEL